MRPCWLMCVLSLLVGCLAADLTPCADGRMCPVGAACDDVHASCVDPAQFVVCEGVAQEAPCSAAGVDGVCLDEVCLAPGCGNGIVEVGAGEVCDDGGRDAGDGCAPDCRSREVCSDGVLAAGEACDDGNLVDRDGCDSRCALEQATWTTMPVAPPVGYAGNESAPRGATFDEERGVLVLAADPIVWEWDRVRWAPVVPTVPLEVEITAFDTDARVVTAVGRVGTARVLATWDGSDWQVRAAMGTPQGAGLVRAVYVDHLQRLLVGIGDDLYLVETQTATWTPAGLRPGDLAFNPSDAYELGYDRVRAVVVAVTRGYGPCCSEPTRTLEWTGAAWTAFAARPTAGARQRLVFDGARGQLLAIGGTIVVELGDGSPVEPPATVEAWNGEAWTPVVTPPIPAGAYPAAWFDASTGILGLTGPDGHTYELGTTLVDRTLPQPIGIQRVATDPVRGRVIAVTDGVPSGAPSETWAWTDHWERLATTQSPTRVRAMAFDPGRGALVATDVATNLWQFDTDWQHLGAAPKQNETMAYDYTGRRMILGAMAPDGTATTWALDSTSVVARKLEFALGSIRGQFAWDSAAARVVALSTTGIFYELAPDRWEQTLSPGLGYVLVERLRAGGVLLAPVGDSLPAWLREGDVWRTTPWEHVAWGPSALVVEREDATTTLFHDGAIVRDLRTVGAGVGETCVAGEDADGDGLAACADRDCWVTCTPFCPAAMSCAP